MVLGVRSTQPFRRIQSVTSARLHSILQHGRRQLSTGAAGSSSSATPEVPGWSMRVKIAGGVALGGTIWWMISVAIKYEPGARRIADFIAPGLVRWLRRREGGHFFDEDPERLEYLAHAPEWMDKPVGLEVRVGHGETRRVVDIDPATPFTSLGDVVRKQGVGLENDEDASGDEPRKSWWLTDFEVLESDSDGNAVSTSASTGQGEGFVSEGYLSSALSSLYLPPAPSVFSRDIAACSIRSWWDIALLEQEAMATTAEPTAIRSAGRKAAGVSSPSAAPAPEMTEEQAKSVDEAIGRAIAGLKQDMASGVRTVDDAEKEIRELRKQQKDLRRNHLRKSRFPSIF